MLSWLLGKKKKKPSPARSADVAQSHLQPAASASGKATALSQAADAAMEQRREQRKQDRLNRREALFGVVRETMLRAGILSSAYKFKVLSIDQHGRHFLVLLDLSLELAESETAQRQLEIEQMITTAASVRCQATVQAVYWRYFEDEIQPPVSKPRAATEPEAAAAPEPLPAAAPPAVPVAAAVAAAPALAPVADSSGSSSADQLEAMLAELRARRMAGGADVPPVAAPQAASVEAPAESAFASTQVISRHEEEVGEEELAAFRRALGEQAQQQIPPDVPPIFEAVPPPMALSADDLDAMMDDEGFADGQNLSATQYGQL